VKTRISPAPLVPKLCSDEEALVISCLKMNHTSARECSGVVESFKRCSLEMATTN
jgi:hypothetical protein